MNTFALRHSKFELPPGARKDRIEAILESLQALGHAHEVEDGRYSA